MNVYKTTRRHITEDSTLCCDRYADTLKSSSSVAMLNMTWQVM
jgi:hypothetical protein